MIKYILLFQLWLTTFTNMIQQEIIGNNSGYYLVDDEKIILFEGLTAIPSNQSDLQQNFSEYIESHQSQLLFEEHRLSDNFTDILIVESYDEKYFMLCLVQNSINCQYKIHNFLLDDKLVIDNQQNIQFSTEFQQCQSIINFKENLYLLIYQQGLTKYALIFDSQNQVLDLISISIASNYTLQFTFYEFQLLFYEIDTYESTITIYQIEHNNTFNKDPKREKIKAKDQKFGKIKYIQKHEAYSLLVTFEYIEIQFNQETPQEDIVKFSMPEGFQMIRRNENLIYGVNQSLQSSEINVFENFLSFGTESLLPIDAFWVEKQLVVVFQQEIKVYQNKLLYHTIKTSSKKVIQLGTLPFFILVTTDVIIYKTQSLPHYIQKDNSKYIFVQQKQNPTFSIKYELKSYSLKYPKFFTQDYFHSIELFDNQKAKIQKGLLYAGIPINFEACYPQNQNEIVEISQTIYQTKFSLNEGLIKLFYHNQFIIAIIQTNQTLLIQVYDEQKQKLTNLKNSGNISQIQNLYIVQQSNIILNKGYYINHYIFDEQQMAFDMIKQIHFSSQIRQIKKGNDKLFILFENCTVLEYQPLLKQISSPKVAKLGMIFQSDCTSAQYSYGTQFFVNRTFITYIPNFRQKRLNIQKMFSFTEILDCDLINEKMLIYELIDQKIIIKLYSMESKDFILLYTLPTYQYRIYFPLQKKILDNSLAILAVYEQQQVILIFKVSNSAAHSLLRVITIDKGQGENFDFIYQYSQLIYYVVNQTVCYQYFNDVELNATFNRNTFVEVIQANCSVKSQISNDVFNVKQSFKFINKRFGISFDGENKLNLKINENNEKIIQLKHVIGVVDYLKLLDETGNCDFKMPLIFVNNQTYFCYDYSTNFCLTQKNQILTDIFGSQRLINLNIEIDNLLSFASVTNEKYYIIYRSYTKNFYYQEMDQTKNFEHAPIFVPEQKKLKSVKRNVNNLFLLKADDWMNSLEIAYINENDIQFLKFSDFQYLDVADIAFYQNYYLILAGNSLSNINFYYTLGNSNQEFTTLNSLMNFTIFEKFQRPELNNNFFEIHDISILKTNFTDNNLLVEFALFLNLDYGYVYSLQINLQNQSYSYSIKNFIRYGIDKIIINVLYCDENLIILKQKNYMEKINIKFYDLDTKKEIIDSYFKTTDTNITQIGYYNSTHFIFLYKQEKQINFILAKVGGYLLNCKTDAKNKAFSVILANEVQPSQAYLMLVNDQQEKQNSFIVVLIFVDLGFIIIIIQFGRRKTNLGVVRLPIK